MPADRSAAAIAAGTPAPRADAIRSAVRSVAGLALLVLLAAARPAWSAPTDAAPRAGTYEADAGAGVLTVLDRPGGVRGFRIEASGANGHSCGLSGSLAGTTGRTGPESEPDACVVTLTTGGDSVAVVAATPQACRAFCGMRAGFEGTYRMPIPACRMPARKASRERFIADYRARRYEAAEATLDRMYRDCGTLLSWIEVDRVRNDLAIARHHLGRDAECLAVLGGTLAATHRDVASLREALPPGDFENYLPVARAAWHNRTLCGARPQG